MKYLLYLLIPFAVCSSIYSQANSSVLNKFIPKNVFIDRNNGGGIAENINSYAKLNPELIYYYLMYIDSYVVNNQTDPQSNYLNLFREKLNLYSQDRYRWFVSQIYKNSLKMDASLARDRVEDIDNSILAVSKLKVEGSTSSLKVDTNKVYYYCYVYYKQDNTIEYNNNENYLELTRQYLETKKDMIISKIKSLRYLKSAEYKSVFKEAFSYWYLIGKDVENSYGVSTGGESFKWLIESLPNKYSLKPQLHLYAGYSPFSPINSVADANQFSDHLNLEHSYEYMFTIPVQIKAKSGVFFGAGFSYPLRGEMKNFSYVKLRAAYLSVKNEVLQPKANTQVRFESQFFQPYFKRYISIYDIDEVKNVKNNVYIAELVTPVYLYKNILFLEAGAQFKYSTLKYEFSILRTVYDWNYNENTLVSKDNLLISKTHNNFEVFPVLYLQWTPFKYINVFERNVIAQKVFMSTSFGIEFNYSL